MKLFDLDHLLAISAIDPATVTPPPTQPVSEGAVVVGTLPPQLIQIWGYHNNLLQTQNVRLAEIKVEAEGLQCKHDAEVTAGTNTEDSCAAHSTNMNLLLEEARAIRKFLDGYRDFFWFCVEQHFELKATGEQCSVGENWSIIKEPREASSFIASIVEEIFGKGSQATPFGGGFFTVIPGSSVKTEG